MSIEQHLAGGVTTVCRAWSVERRDGVTLGFTDHDRSLTFEGVAFRADTGLSARAFEQSTGLAVDNTEAVGVLSDDAIREDDIRAGHYDGAKITLWLVNWAAPEERRLVFRGSLGEMERQGKLFRAELRGLAEALNQSHGRVYQKPCSAVLGDGLCGFDTLVPGFFLELEVAEVVGEAEIALPSQPGFSDEWFQRGRLTVLSGDAAGTISVIKRDREYQGLRRVEMWQAPVAELATGDVIRLEAGCDKRAATCREKFDNFLNFRGFPDIPGEDWLVSYPIRAGMNDGGSLR